MSRIHRLRRRAGHSAVTHDRARRLAAERLDSLLEPADRAWLAEHLAGCEACRAVAAAYDADRAILRRLRDGRPTPPRDLWARTAAALDREAAAREGRARPVRSGRTTRAPAVGALSGLAVVAIVVTAAVMSRAPIGGPSTAGASPASSAAPVAIGPTPAPVPTPIAVGAGSVRWLDTAPDGELAYNITDVDAVCPADRQPDCARVAPVDPKRVKLTIRPKSVAKSPSRNQAVVVGTDASGGDTVVVIALPTDDPDSGGSPRPSDGASVEPTEPATTGPTMTPESTEPPVSPSTAESTPSPTIEATPTISAEPTVAANLALVSDVKIVGQSAAYSPDGSWFAFSARPSDGSGGPDVYVWQVGSDAARRLTDDHRSVFASWVGRRVLASRTADPADPVGGAPESFFIDPSTGDETAIEGGVWRPTVDPTGHWAVAWNGTVQAGPLGLTAVPADGSLILSGFDRERGFAAAEARDVPLAESRFADFDVRWDEDGEWFAVWLADSGDPSIGRLSLLHLDPATGRMDRPDGAPRDVRAMPGFSIGDGRLAWATPPGQGGEGSRVQIVAWADVTVGTVESGPAEGVILVH